MMRLTKNQILQIHEELIKEFGGTYGIRDENLLELSINSPYHTFDGKDLYESNIEKAVHMGYSLIMNHPFMDGNKRIGTNIMMILLELSGHELEYSQKELIEIILDISSSKKTEKELLNWVIEHIK